jgi:orotate phosphoribosyltransferase-like protein
MPKIIGKSTIEKIIELREKEGISFKEIGKMLNLSDDTVRKYYYLQKKEKEKEEVKPYEINTALELKKLAEKNEVSLEELVDTVAEWIKSEIDIKEAREATKFAKALREIGMKEKKNIKGMIEWLIKERKTIDDLQQKKNELSKEVMELKTRVENLKQEIINAGHQLKEKEESIRKLQKKKKEIIKDIQELKLYHNQLFEKIRSQAIQAAEEEIKKRKEEIERELKKEVERVRQEVREYYQILTRLLPPIILNQEFVFQVLDIAQQTLEKAKFTCLNEIFERFNLYFQIYHDQQAMVEAEISKIVDPLVEKIKKLKALVKASVIRTQVNKNRGWRD